MDTVELRVPSHPGINALAVSINNQARSAGVPPCALAAIVANETGGRNVYQEGMPKGPGCGVGLCQITSGVNWSGDGPTYLADGQAWDLMDPSSNLYVAAKYYLAPAIAEITNDRINHRTQYERFSGEVLYFVFAAYNAGLGEVLSCVHTGDDPDAYTTDHYAQRAFILYRTFVAESYHNA
jgi:hypothetical protein